MGGWWLEIFVGIPYLLNLLNVLRLAWKVCFTDPGILPKVQNTLINYDNWYVVSYRQPHEKLYDVTKSEAENFFSQR